MKMKKTSAKQMLTIKKYTLSYNKCYFFEEIFDE